MKEIKLFLSLFLVIAIFVNPVSSGINVTDADAIYEAGLSVVKVPTNPYPLKNIFILNEETDFRKDLYPVKIPTSALPLQKVFKIKDEASLEKNLYLVKIPTEPLPVTEMFFHLDESRLSKELVFPKQIINDITPPNITNVTAINITSNSTKITWDTDEIADSLVKYNKDEKIMETKDDLLVFNHSIELTKLSSNTVYNYVVKSTDRNGNSNESAVYTFKTLPGITPKTPPSANISPESTTIYSGNSFSIDVIVYPHEYGISSGQIDLSFNTSMLEVIGLTKGDILGSDAIDSGSNYDNTAGTVTTILARIGNTTSPTLSGTWATVTFNVKSGVSGGTTIIRVTKAKLNDENFADIPGITTSDGSVTIKILVGDINGDGTVDYTDLGMLGASYGLSVGDPGYNPYADLNKDGIVNYTDLGMLASNYGKSI